MLARTRHPVTSITKDALIERDLARLVDPARDNLVRVMVSITTLDNRLSSKLQPRASAPHRRIETVRARSAAAGPVRVLVAPMIPMITDRFLEEILQLSHAAGAQCAGYVLVRLPHEVKDIFRDWLRVHFPDRTEHVTSLIQQTRGDRDYDARFGTRMKGDGVFADLLKARFTRMQRPLGLGLRSENPPDTSLFHPPRKAPPQGDVFAGCA